jgi:acetyl-CoA carboxylase carboxyl transferase subunit beta
MAGSLGMAAGEAVVTGMMRAVERRSPFILFAASGGARMQEGILSLMQMPRTTIAVQMLREARLPYLVVLTDPTTGGVSASYAMLGDIHIAEPGALICFAGPRVIQQTIREQLPDGFQKAEYLLAHGMIDMVVHRHRMRETLARLCRMLTGNAAGARASRSLSPAVEEHGHLNGSVVDGTTIETLARSYDDVLEPGKDQDGERDSARG